MSIASEITRISGNIADAYTSLSAKGATMPATENSANLADTIDSITTGGGGGTPVVRGNWTVPPEFIALDEKVTEIGTTCAQTETDKITAVGYYFNKRLMDGNLYLFVPTSYNYRLFTVNGEITSSITRVDVSYATYTLAQNEDYIIFVRDNVYGFEIQSPMAHSFQYGIYRNNKTKVAQCESLEYISVWSDVTSGYVRLDGGFAESNLKSVHSIVPGKVEFYNIKWMQFNNFAYLPSITEAVYTSMQKTTATPFRMFDLLPNLPDGFDYSSYTTDWNLGENTSGKDGSYLYNSIRLKRMYVTLPNANVVFNKNDGSWDSIGVHLTPDNWNYIAEHAPTVTSKTITIDKVNEESLGATNKATLESKGWTVSVFTVP